MVKIIGVIMEKKERKKFRSLAVPVDTLDTLWEIAMVNHRSPAQQVAFLVELASKNPSDADMIRMFANVQKQSS
tara:strand:- start:53 stop:274 length:222 start_codon:yes stop_codon:yes gene_type:complete